MVLVRAQRPVHIVGTGNLDHLWGRIDISMTYSIEIEYFTELTIKVEILIFEIFENFHLITIRKRVNVSVFLAAAKIVFQHWWIFNTDPAICFHYFAGQFFQFLTIKRFFVAQKI
jgi:hypothetical protein